MKQFSLILTMVLLTVSTVFAQKTITGTVMLEGEGEAIGANVFVEGNESNGTTTEYDGTFSLEVPNDATALTISYTGFMTQVVTINGNSVGSITLAPDSEVLEEVIVTGYQTLKAGDVSTAASVVTGEDIQAVPIANVQNLLQGKSTGLQVTASNGKPGGGAYMRIRGTGSANASNDPLYVVDGAQVPATVMNAINPNDIASVTVLKDAAATAIYGSSGSNGVVVITTKRGTGVKGARPEITFSSQFGVKSKTEDNFEMMNAQQKMDYETELFNEYGIGNGTAVASYADGAIRDSLIAVSGDWQDILLRTGTFQSYNLTMGGSGEKGSYYASVGYYDEEGIAMASNFTRLTARLNSDYRASDWLTLGSSFSITHTDSDELRDRNNVQNPFSAMYTYNSYESEYLLNSPDPTDIRLDASGNPEYNLTHQGFSITEAMINNPSSEKFVQLLGTAYAEFRPIEGLSLKTQVNGNFLNISDEYFIKPGSVLDGYVGDPAAPGIGSYSGTRRFTYQWNNFATYTKTFAEKHNTSFLVGTEFYDYNRYRHSVSGKGFPNGTLYTLDNAAVIDGGFSARDESGKLSAFTNVNYNYMRKYLATFTYRTDGSSSFGDDNRYGHFLAGSAAWNIHLEDFAQNFSNVVSQLKLRVSSGTSGNDTGASSYTRLGTIGVSALSGQTALQVGRGRNDGLSWEKNFSNSLGLDFGLFDSRITGALDLYHRKTFDLLFDAPLSAFGGDEDVAERRNIGSVINKGIELELSADVIRMPAQKFNVEVYGSYSLNMNDVQSLPDQDGDPLTPTEIPSTTELSVVTEGEEFYTYKLVRFAGVDPANGDELWYDADGNITNEWSGDDAVVLSGKSVLPKYYGSFGTNITFRGVRVGVDFYYNAGNYIYNQMAANMLSDGGNITSNQRVDANDFWRNPGDISDRPRPTGQSFDSDRFLQRGDFLRLRNLTIGYQIPVKTKVITGVNVYAQATNLATWTKYEGDPEVGIGSDESNFTVPGEISLYSYPQTMGLTFGLDVNF